ncbi:interaptin, putative [Entamoeba histolytica HM-1:IMSS]|uniref:Interaptin, putative n=2 Tax=Entamoeba histolytica TaxID=5759 RepID=C4MA92_ENTH1|nr:interaptin, putative [Entamoeba histolytica HM-1:IMSS]EAL43360.2 interaptin, putative [Entamoeba histolytica HM-1:IMSS]|eukprot:XP_648743.2 interaptin, putative [Entamoeba histolytica HM-1:IMSS]
MQQRDSTNVVISMQEDVSINVPVGANEGTMLRNVTALMTSTQYFHNYMGMYDQFKLNAVRASMEMTFIGNQLLNSATFPSICTAWDRNGVRINTAVINNTRYFQLPAYSSVSSYSSANEKTLYYGSRWGVVRQLDAASMMEKSMYLPTTNTRDVLSMDNMYSAWNPQLLIAIKTPQAVNVANACTLTIHWQFDVTLRGLRKVLVTDENSFKPYAGFIGYARNNNGLVVPSNIPNAQPPYILVGAIANGFAPSINPETVYDNANDAYSNGGAGKYVSRQYDKQPIDNEQQFYQFGGRPYNPPLPDESLQNIVSRELDKRLGEEGSFYKENNKRQKKIDDDNKSLYRAILRAQQDNLKNVHHIERLESAIKKYKQNAERFVTVEDLVRENREMINENVNKINELKLQFGDFIPRNVRTQIKDLTEQNSVLKRRVSQIERNNGIFVTRAELNAFRDFYEPLIEKQGSRLQNIEERVNVMRGLIDKYPAFENELQNLSNAYRNMGMVFSKQYDDLNSRFRHLNTISPENLNAVRADLELYKNQLQKEIQLLYKTKLDVNDAAKWFDQTLPNTYNRNDVNALLGQINDYVKKQEGIIKDIDSRLAEQNRFSLKQLDAVTDKVNLYTERLDKLEKKSEEWKNVFDVVNRLPEHMKIPLNDLLKDLLEEREPANFTRRMRILESEVKALNSSIHKIGSGKTEEITRVISLVNSIQNDMNSYKKKGQIINAGEEQFYSDDPDMRQSKKAFENTRQLLISRFKDVNKYIKDDEVRGAQYNDVISNVNAIMKQFENIAQSFNAEYVVPVNDMQNFHESMMMVLSGIMDDKSNVDEIRYKLDVASHDFDKLRGSWNDNRNAGAKIIANKLAERNGININDFVEYAQSFAVRGGADSYVSESVIQPRKRMIRDDISSDSNSGFDKRGDGTVTPRERNRGYEIMGRHKIEPKYDAIPIASDYRQKTNDLMRSSYNEYDYEKWYKEARGRIKERVKKYYDNPENEREVVDINGHITESIPRGVYNMIEADEIGRYEKRVSASKRNNLILKRTMERINKHAWEDAMKKDKTVKPRKITKISMVKDKKK